MENRGNHNSGFVSATDLAQIGYCEMQMLLRSVEGDKVTPEQQESRVRGKVVHADFHERVVADHNRSTIPAARDRRCFIATAVYGPDDVRTDELRYWRDRVLSRSALGRGAIVTYYAVSPMVANWIEKSCRRRRIVALMLDAIRAMIRTTERPIGMLEQNQPSKGSTVHYGRGEA